MRRHDLTPERVALEAFEATEPPPRFAQEVVAQFVAKDAPDIRVPQPRRRRPMAYAIGVGALLVCSTAMVLWRSGNGSHTGSIAGAGERVTVRLGQRGTAVLEPAAHVSWTIDRWGDAHIRQLRGDVFYRVEGGGPFRVDTGAGSVTVTGTCFRVEVDPVSTKSQLRAGAIGAVMAGAMLVTVYEGKVRLASDRGQVDVAAGERALVSPSQAPARIGEGRSDSARARGGALPTSVPSFRLVPAPDELALLRDRNAELESKLQEVMAERQRGRPPADDLNPSKEELLRRAKECSVAYDHPWLGRGKEGPPAAHLREKFDATPDEIEIMLESRKRLAQRIDDEIRRLFIQVTGDSRAAQVLSQGAMRAEIQDKSPAGEAQRAYQRLAAERAGLRPVPASTAGQSPYEQLARMQVGIGDEHERDLARELGPQRARALREQRGGWEGGTHTTPGCPGQE